MWGSGAWDAFVHVDDVVDALVAAVPSGFGQGAIQIGPDVCTSIREVAEQVVAISGKEIGIEYDLSAPEGDRGRCADFTKARTPSAGRRRSRSWTGPSGSTPGWTPIRVPPEPVTQ